MLSASPILYAHRGASLELPENTLEAFRLALDLGAHAIETDAHMTRDGRIVLSHDPTGERQCGVPRAISETTFEEVRSWDVGARFVGKNGVRVLFDQRFQMPTLEEALAAFPDTVFNVDAKQVSPDMVPALVRCIRAARAEDRVRVASFSGRNLRKARALGHGHTGLSAGELAPVLLAPLPIAKALGVRGEAAQIPQRAWGVALATQARIDKLHALGLRVDFWTINDADEARHLLALGADGIMTDDPRAVAPAFELVGGTR